MPTIKRVESQIWRAEGFEVRIRHVGPGPVKGRDVRGDRGEIRGYHFKRRRANEDSVSSWVQGRVRKGYPGCEVDLLEADGSTANGRKKLRTVRASYEQ